MKPENARLVAIAGDRDPGDRLHCRRAARPAAALAKRSSLVNTSRTFPFSFCGI
jgi:hypothetical protein